MYAQTTTILRGVIKDTNNQAIEGVNIQFNTVGTTSDKNGNYSLRIPLNQSITITYSHIAHYSFTKEITATSKNLMRFSPILTPKTEALKEIVVKNNKKNAAGITKIDVLKAKNIIGPNAGVENVLMTLPGVNNNNELSTQYNVRGGNFDENLVYVNGIEIYRPFLIRSGQQEGLSFVNANLVKNINFSAGGFQAKYGDKLSSVLDITYRDAKERATSIDASILGGSITLEGQFLDKKLSAITGVRYRDNSLFVNSKQVETNFKPQFTDVQSFLSYKATDAFTLNFLGNFSLNNYNYTPISRRTRFGTVNAPLELTVFYEGQEKNNYLTLFGALSANYKLNDAIDLIATASSYNTQEEEYFDIAAAYNLGEVDANVGSEDFGEVEFSEGIGSQLNHARNDLDALISNFQLKGIYKKDALEISAGLKYSFGVRAQNWNVSGNGVRSKNQVIISPRAQFAIKPDWSQDMLFRVSSGWYSQPPSYRELKDYNGQLNVDVKAQKSIHLVAGMDYSFQMWERPFKLTTELYYKDLNNINAYSIDNVRIRYRADNKTIGYATGVDVRLNGEFIAGSESWVSLGYLKTMENINHQGYIARPSDQRLKFGILFQDYVPNLPDLKAYLNLVFNTGVPGGSPSYSNPYDFQNRLRDYKRADLGVSYVFTSAKKQFTTGFRSHFKALTAGLELFNMFDIQNAITNTWVRDVYSKAQFGVPNFMTGRVLNFKIGMQF